MRKRIASAVASLIPALCWAQASLHESPLGTRVEGSFVLAGKGFPLPPGPFTLVQVEGRTAERTGVLNPFQPRSAPLDAPASDRVEVLLVQTEGARLRMTVFARVNASLGVRRKGERCGGPDMLFRLDRAAGADDRFDCVTMWPHHRYLYSPIGDTDQHLAERLKARGIDLPVRTVIQATLTRIEADQFWQVMYGVNPEAFGLPQDPHPGTQPTPWHPRRIHLDAKRAAFAQALQQWALNLRYVAEQGLRGDPIHPAAIPRLQLPAGS